MRTQWKKWKLLGVATLLGGLAWTVHTFSGSPLPSRNYFEASDQFILYSINPIPKLLSDDAAENKQRQKQWGSSEIFQEYRVIGKTEITDSEVKARLLDALYGGLDGENPYRMMCFSPRHGIRAIRGSKTVDLLICFKCARIDVTSPLRTGSISINETAQWVFDRVLTAAKVPLAQPCCSE
jgi:hypothetical protein